MHRDFTEEAENALLTVAYIYESGYNNNYVTDEELDDYYIYMENFDSAYDFLESINMDYLDMVTECIYSRDTIQSIFTDVREYDENHAKNTIAVYNDTTFLPYMETMNALLDIIRVSPKGSSVDVNQYATDMSLAYGDAGEYSSIFGNTEAFIDGLSSAGQGVITSTYDKLRDPEAFAELMNKSEEDIREWEIIALSKMLDDFIIVDENGIYSLDTEGLEAFMEKAYIQTDYNAPDWHTQHQARGDAM